jgi:membrane protease YdiL (CAAX protease family)
MRPLLSLTVYLAFVLAGGALLAPILYHAVQAGAQNSEFWRSLSEQSFHRYVNRSMLGLALVGLVPFLRSLGIRRWQDVGFAPWKGQASSFGTGVMVGLLSLAVVAGGQVLAGVRHFEFAGGGIRLVSLVTGAAATALIVATLEELLFRGVLFGALRRGNKWGRALVISSAVYALVHFFEKPPRPSGVDWLTGYSTLGKMLSGFVDVRAMIPGFLCLGVAGAILGLGYQRTGTLYFSIGLHAGWIFWLRLYGEITKSSIKGVHGFWGSRKLTDGWAALFLLSLLLLALWRCRATRWTTISPSTPISRGAAPEGAI